MSDGPVGEWYPDYHPLCGAKIGRMTELTVIHDACEDDGLVRLDCEHGSFMVSPCIKAEADAHTITTLKAKIAQWVEKHNPYPMLGGPNEWGDEAEVFRVIHTVANVGPSDDGTPDPDFQSFYLAEIGKYEHDGFEQAYISIDGGFFLDGRADTELAALEALDEKLKKLDDYE